MMSIIEDDFKELRSMVFEMLPAEDRGFTDWEINFLEDMKKRSLPFTGGQAACIEKIYKQKM